MGARAGRMPGVAALGCVCLALTLPACDLNAELSGSLSDVYRLDHEHVRARLYESELSIEYVRNDGSVPVRVTCGRRVGKPLGKGDFDIGSRGAVTGQLSDGTTIPKFLDGNLKLDEFQARDGAPISGSFDARFDGGRDTLSLSGSFDTELEVIDWPLLPDAGMDDEEEP